METSLIQYDENSTTGFIADQDTGFTGEQGQLQGLPQEVLKCLHSV